MNKNEAKEKISELVKKYQRIAEAGKITAYKIGKEFRIEKKEFERFLEGVRTLRA